MCTESIVKYESYKLLRQAWRVQYCDGELAVKVFYSCSSASSRSLPEEGKMLRKEIDGSYIWRFASTPSVVAAVHSR